MRAALIWYFRAFALGCAWAAIFHTLCIFDGSLEPRLPLWEHVVFVPANLVLLVGCLRRPPWFVAFFALYTLQQLYSHGTLGWCAWRQGILDWRSLIVVIMMPLTLALLIYERRLRSASAVGQ
jgi:hypothetical protein